ncbi:glycosyltransferase sugar-binding region containing DXD motif [Gluconacetobacter diazotrophicus PA1 5]|uniref:Glycosyl transferase n=2 Tax=Gluconacetobacter diazotrophicus TaxID=33996 RepID=A0A7W4FC72_GLUDI|nr:glycosyltransferase [Gluconacetobacter diazotrophicus]ACI51288.1 glycosyltransferase sugar-binding region containing DXD motif [Gluconacetobacter diazotrophicus PA1 5]MBB2155008.1 glycosyl transferase [Gluconacetobacter diazotrophicus]TWB09836.1 glycosyl transferase-like sugar-binding protein [Gluconacetobacter diazotrophicus]
MTIPACVHFCWIGPTLPWAYVFAVLSAAENSGMADIVLHHTDALAEGPERRALERAPKVRLSHIDPVRYLTEVERAAGLDAGRLVAFYDSVATPVQRADILRVAILYREGGVYLDMDTITTASFRPLLGARQFVGTERIVWPHAVRTSRSPAVRARHVGLSLARKAFRIIPHGWKGFRHIEHFYPRGMNNAVLGAEPGAPWIDACLHAMLALSTEQRVRPYALGPHLLQRQAGPDWTGDLTVHDPAVFYPVPPEISEHLFRFSRQVRAREVLRPRTCVVHWYASVRTKSRVAQITPRYVRDHRRHQLYSALVCAFVTALPDDEENGA